MTSITLPCNEDYERTLLAGILGNIDVASEMLFSLKENDFYFPKHQALFREMKFVFAKNHQIDFYLLSIHLKTSQKFGECGDVGYVMDISNLYQSSVSYSFYAEEIKDLSAKRKLIYLSNDTIQECAKTDIRFDSVSQNMFKSLFEIQGIGKIKTYQMADVLQKYSEHGNFKEHVEWMQERVNAGLTPYTGISCGYPILDRILGFFRPGCVYYIGARTSMGKTTFMLNLIRGIFSNGNKVPVGIFSLEMPSPLIVAKLVCLMADVKFSNFEDMRIYPEEKERIFERGEYMEKLPIYIEDEEDISISKLRARSRRLVQNYGVKIIFIDYLTRIKSDTKYPSKHLQVDEISKGLQSLAKELNVPVICLAQLNRASMNKTTPSLSDFRESGSIEEDCDAALLLHRPDYYNPNDFPGQVQVIVAKNRIRGQLRKIAFGKSANSELYQELEDLGEEIKKCNERLNNPQKGDYDD